jgi:NAD(P)-dependent dehydrogenase (short-subunit alcohol dehydrogenase family)
LQKNILITGSTDGIGLETAKMLLEQGHYLLLHGRNPQKLERVKTELSAMGKVESYLADLSDLGAVKNLAKSVADKHQTLDVLINNAGIYKTPAAVTSDGLDIRFAVNAIAPYLLTKALLPRLGRESRVVNLSSAAQAPVNLQALAGKIGEMGAMAAYSQSKLAIIMWSFAMATSLGKVGPIIVAVNPGSLLGSKMVKEGFGVAGNDIGIGANILTRIALSDEFADASGKYFDNDRKKFAEPHPDALDGHKCSQLAALIDDIIKQICA